MRGEITPQDVFFSYRTLESRIQADHSIRKVRKVVDQALKELTPTFDGMYSSLGRTSIPQEQLIRAILLQVLFTIRSERQLVERLDYDLMFRWFVGLGIGDEVWNHSTFSKNRDRLMVHEIDTLFFDAIKSRPMPKS